MADDLLRRVVSGGLKEGDLLPKEAELAESYGVNRGVVREAIKLLEVHRLVQPVRRRGTAVLDPLASLSPDVLRAMLMPRPGELDRGVLRDLLEVREELDVHMTGLAAERRTDADLDALSRAVGDVREALGSSSEYAARMDEIALAVAAATQNRVYVMLVHWHRLVHADLRELFLTVRLAREPHVMGIELLVDLIRRGDAETARRLVRAYHGWATPRILTAAALSNGEPLDRVMEEIR